VSIPCNSNLCLTYFILVYEVFAKVSMYSCICYVVYVYFNSLLDVRGTE